MKYIIRIETEVPSYSKIYYSRIENKKNKKSIVMVTISRTNAHEFDTIEEAKEILKHPDFTKSKDVAIIEPVE